MHPWAMGRRRPGKPPARKGGFFNLKNKYNMDIFNAFATDESLETNGKWFQLSKTARVLVARRGNQNYRDYMREAFKENPLDGLPEKEANALAETLLLEAEARTILLKWEGITFKGQDMPVTVENAKTLLSVKDFRAKIQGFADNLDAFRVKEEAEQGNA